MKIVQVIPSLAYGDAIGNDTLAIRDILLEQGYETELYAENVLKPLAPSIARPVSELSKLKKQDIALYHLSTGTELNFEIAKLNCKKVAIYHNVTPPHYFARTNDVIRKINEWALEGVRFLADKLDYCLAVSDYNKEELIKMGYRCPIDVIPIIIPFDDYKKSPDNNIMKQYRDGKTNILFTGRVVPNKKQEDVIKAFYYYKKYYNDHARLIILGSCANDPAYVKKLQLYAETLGVKDVHFTGHIKFNEILAFYRIADLFLCMSEHEGFCVPLVEAMFFDIPIVARATSAIPYTLGGSGILLPDQDALAAAGMLHYLNTHEELKRQVVEGQRIRLEAFAYDKVKEQFLQSIRVITGEQK